MLNKTKTHVVHPFDALFKRGGSKMLDQVFAWFKRVKTWLQSVQKMKGKIVLKCVCTARTVSCVMYMSLASQTMRDDSLTSNNSGREKRLTEHNLLSLAVLLPYTNVHQRATDQCISNQRGDRATYYRALSRCLRADMRRFTEIYSIPAGGQPHGTRGGGSHKKTRPTYYRLETAHLTSARMLTPAIECHINVAATRSEAPQTTAACEKRMFLEWIINSGKPIIVFWRWHKPGEESFAANRGKGWSGTLSNPRFLVGAVLHFAPGWVTVLSKRVPAFGQQVASNRDTAIASDDGTQRQPREGRTHTQCVRSSLSL